ncbi:lactonase family protein [Gloeobacter violaceus]|uniref:lactonase family protein n=1 Tax=Gloeobacter violaceus TaxID=33072 RepID=UPI0013E8AB18|nr:lactonase family protein [Gloeobacter violaceus]
MKDFTRGRWLWVVGIVAAIAIVGLVSVADPLPVAERASDRRPLPFAGRALLIASDGDMVGTAYSDGKLNRLSGIEDALTVIDLPLPAAASKVASVAVSNSVMSWPQILATAPDGSRAYVVEVRGRPPQGVQEYADLDTGMPTGSLLTVVDLTHPGGPTVLETVPVGRNPRQIAISPDGRLLAIGVEEPGRELLLVELVAGRPGRRFSYAIADASGQSARITSVGWHPSGRFLALNLNDREMAFFEVLTDQKAATATLRPQGERLVTGVRLGVGRFSPDGRHYLLTDLKWGERPLGYLLNPRGELIAVRFDAGPALGAKHRVVCRIEVGLSPEGFAVSPDGLLVATVNMRRTYLPDWLPVWPGKARSSLSLVKRNPQSGQLTVVGEYGFEGVLPEDAVFDAAGRALAVAVYHYREPRASVQNQQLTVEAASSFLETTSTSFAYAAFCLAAASGTLTR